MNEINPWVPDSVGSPIAKRGLNEEATEIFGILYNTQKKFRKAAVSTDAADAATGSVASDKAYVATRIQMYAEDNADEYPVTARTDDLTAIKRIMHHIQRKYQPNGYGLDRNSIAKRKAEWLEIEAAVTEPREPDAAA